MVELKSGSPNACKLLSPCVTKAHIWYSPWRKTNSIE